MEPGEEKGCLRIRRDRLDSLKMAPKFTYSNPQWIAKELAFTTKRKKDKFCKLLSNVTNNGFRNGKIKVSLIEEMQKWTEELGKMIETDPRLGDLIDKEPLLRLYQLLKHDKYPDLQAHAATILEPVVVNYPRNKDVVLVIRLVTPVIVNLISQVHNEAQMEALWLLCHLVFAIEKSSTQVALIEEALSPITSLIMKKSTYGLLDAAGATLAAICEVFPKFSPKKLKLALPALIKLIQSNVLTLLTSGCDGLALLCDGREEMVVEEEHLDCLIGRLVNLMNSAERIMVISALHVMGSIVRWGSDDVVEAIIKKDGALLILSSLLKVDDMYIVKQTCWILSNITGRSEKHIRAVIDGELIGPLVNVVRKCTLFDVQEVAVWALSNALCGVGLDQIECLRKSCCMVSWHRILHRIRHDKLCVLVISQGLVNIKVVKITWDGQPIDGIELQSIFKEMRYKMWTESTFCAEGGHILFELMVDDQRLALWLLCHLVFAIEKSSTEVALIEEALSPITSLIMKKSTYGLLDAAGATLAAICEVFPKFSPKKLKLVLPALIKLIQSNVLTLLTSGCLGLALLCDGREEMVVDEEHLDCLFGRLVNLMNSVERIMVISALHVMGSIVRWGSDDFVEAIIKDGALLILSSLLKVDDMYIVKQICWILSNITGRSEKHIRAVIDGELIGPLVNVVRKCTLFDVQEVAVWALSNALCGVGLDQIECLRKSCSMVSWHRILHRTRHDKLCVLVISQGLVNIEAVKITWDGRPIDGIELQSIFKEIRYKMWTESTFCAEGGHILFELMVDGQRLVCCY